MTDTPVYEGHTDEDRCLDCGTALVGPHCHICGQGAHMPRTLRALWHDMVIHGVLHLNGRLSKTLHRLLLRPGMLARDYVSGRRTRFVSPLGMFLFSFVLLFAIVQITGVAKMGETATIFPGIAVDRAYLDLKTGIDADPLSRGIDAPSEEELAALPYLVRLQGEQERLTRIERSRNALFFIEQARKALAADGDPRDLDRAVESEGMENVRRGVSDPALLIYKLQANSYKFSWLLIPILVPLVWLVFIDRRRDFSFYEHASFVTYSLAFASLSGATAILLGLVTGWVMAVTLFLLAYIVHSALALRQFYRLGWGGTLVRTALFQVAVQVGLMAFLAIVSLIVEAG